MCPWFSEHGGQLQPGSGQPGWEEKCNTTHTYIGRRLQHVVSMPARDGHEGNCGWVIADLLDVGADLLDDLIVAFLAVWGLCGIHLVDAHDELLHPQGVSQQGVLTSLPVLGDASFKFTDTGSNNQDSAVSLGGES